MADGSTGGADAPASPPQWLTGLKAKSAQMRARKERPRGKPFGRWLGDFLDQDTPGGLLPAEETLLFAVVQGEACVLQSRAARVWGEFDAWIDAIGEQALPPDEGFAGAMGKFLAGAPVAIQEIIRGATRKALVELGLPDDWEPQDAADVRKLVTAQQAYFERQEAEAKPEVVIAAAKKDKSFFILAVEAVTQALPPPPGKRVQLSDKSFAPLLRNDPLNLTYEIKAKIAAQPRVLRDFFGELVQHVKSLPGTDGKYLSRLKADPTVLRPHFDAAFERYRREWWRWVDPGDPEVRVRAGFLRFLALGGDDAAPVHERRLEVHGAYVEEDVDLSGCRLPQPLLFFRCYFTGSILLIDAITKSLDLQRSRVRSIGGEGAQIRGGVFLHNGFRSTKGVSFLYANIEGRLSGEGSTFLSGGAYAINCGGARIAGDAGLYGASVAEGGVFFSGAKIGGDLLCAGGTFRNRTEDGLGTALGCNDAGIAGNVSLSNGFRSEGSVSFFGAKIGGQLNCDKATFFNRRKDGQGVALTCDDAEIEGDVNLTDGFSAEGQVTFCGARAGSNFNCFGGRFDNSTPDKTGGSSAWTPRVATAINLQGAKIDGIFWLGPHAGDAFAKADIAGSMKLDGSHAHEIIDHPSSWPSRKVEVSKGKKLPAYIYLDGFTYDRFAGPGDYGTGTRKKWLDRQPLEHLGVNFRPQPFEQLIKVYREMGQERQARDIAKFKERRRRRANFIKLWHGWQDRPRTARRLFGDNALGSALDWLLWPFAPLARAIPRSLMSIFYALEWAIVGFGAAYGYGYLRLGLFLLALWIAGGLYYSTVAEQGGFAPSNPAIYLNKELQAKCGKSWTACKGAPAELPSFSPFTYSLYVMLPVLDLGQKHDWQPIDRPDHPVKVTMPELYWLPNNDPHHTEIPEIRGVEQPLGEGTLVNIVRTQMLLSWAALGLLFAVLSRIVKRD